MKVLHYSDKSSPLFLELYQECEVLITTGDLTQADFFGLEDIAEKKPSFGVYGNHDSGNYMKDLGIVNIHNRVIEDMGLKWGGFQSCLAYKNSPLMFTIEEAREFSNSFPYVDVLLLHVGPKGMLDDDSDFIHQGSEHIRRYVLEKMPKFIFCGHQYSDSFLEVGETKIWRSFGARVIEIDV